MLLNWCCINSVIREDLLFGATTTTDLWILATGSWNDGGIWEDGDVWID